MKIFVTGATGLVGRALTLRLRRDGHTVVAWVRSPARARTLLGDEATLVDAAGGDAAMAAGLAGCDGVVNLAGSPVAAGRWGAATKAEILASREETTAALVRNMATLSPRPRVLVSASAVGRYGADLGAAAVGEDTPAGTDFLAEVCGRWEAAALAARPLGLRVAIARIGLVLGHGGGLLGALLPPFQAGLGTVLGDGAQYMPWIHLHDLVDALACALTDARYDGPFNACAPAPVTQSHFVEALAACLGVRAPLRVPAPLLRLALGEAASAPLSSCRALPTRLTAWHFAFSYPSLAGALTALLDPDAATLTALADDRAAPAPMTPDHPYLTERRPTHLLRAQTALRQPLDAVFAFFCRAENLGLMTPPDMALTIAGAPPAAVHTGTTIDYTLRIGPVPLRWRTLIALWDVPNVFVDAQVAGPYRAWWHEHHFRADAEGTVMEDRVFYRMPLGPLGAIAHVAQVRAQLRRIFWYRASAIVLRFGARAA